MQRKWDDFQAAGAYSQDTTLQELSLKAIDTGFGVVRACYFDQKWDGGIFETTALLHKELSTCRTENTEIV